MKFSQYNIEIDMEYGLLVYNLMLERGFKLLKTNTEEFEHYTFLKKASELLDTDNMVSVLKDRGFIVDDECDEYKEAKEKINSHCKHDSLNILLHVTDLCNFKCIYCFKKAKPKNFSDQNWQNLLLYIQKQIVYSDYKTINFTFYGGEPLLRFEKIINFMKKVNAFVKNYPNKTIQYNCVTNAYLLNPQVYDQLVSQGLHVLQITLDGFAKQHDETRPKLDGSGTWDIIYNNLKYINTVDDTVKVTLRFNYNKKTLSIIPKYKKWFQKTFKQDKFTLDFEPISKLSDYVDDKLIINDQHIIDRYSNMSTVTGYDLLSFKMPGYMCPYSQGNSFSITTDGSISICEDGDCTEVIIGVLSNTGELIYNYDFDTWVNRFEKEDCKTCVAYPICGSRVCMQSRKCSQVFSRLNNNIKKIQEGNLKLL